MFALFSPISRALWLRCVCMCPRLSTRRRRRRSLGQRWGNFLECWIFIFYIFRFFFFEFIFGAVFGNAFGSFFPFFQVYLTFILSKFESLFNILQKCQEQLVWTQPLSKRRSFPSSLSTAPTLESRMWSLLLSSSMSTSRFAPPPRFGFLFLCLVFCFLFSFYFSFLPLFHFSGSLTLRFNRDFMTWRIYCCSGFL